MPILKQIEHLGCQIFINSKKGFFMSVVKNSL